MKIDFNFGLGTSIIEDNGLKDCHRVCIVVEIESLYSTLHTGIIVFVLVFKRLWQFVNLGSADSFKFSFTSLKLTRRNNNIDNRSFERDCPSSDLTRKRRLDSPIVSHETVSGYINGGALPQRLQYHTRTIMCVLWCVVPGIQ